MTAINNKSSGFSLVELMVSSVIALGVMASAINLMLTSRSNFNFQQELARIQDSGRFALEYISSEIRMAGYSGCDNRPIVWSANFNQRFGSDFGVAGYDRSQTIPAYFSDAIENQDVLIVHRGVPENGQRIVQADFKKGEIKLESKIMRPISQWYIYVDGKCRYVGLFKGNVAGTGVVSFKGLRDWNRDFEYGARLLPWQTSSFYLAVNSQMRPALFIKQSQLSNNVQEDPRQELIEGVVAMRFRYGVDMNGDGVVDEYRRSKQLADKWGHVVSVEVSLLLRSLAKHRGSVTPTTFYGEVYDDGYIYRSFSTTVALRSQGRG